MICTAGNVTQDVASICCETVCESRILHC